MSFTQRFLKMSFQLGQGTFGDGSSTQVDIEGLRARAFVERAGGFAMGTLRLEVYGMDLSTMNTLSTLGTVPLTVRRNTVIVYAYDSSNISSPTKVFEGTITSAYADLSNQPDAVMRVEASAGYLQQIQPGDPSSYKGSVDAALVLQTLAGQMSVPFKNNGNFSAQLTNPYYSGSYLDQAQACVTEARCSWNKLEDGTLSIWPPGQAREGDVPIVSPDTGMDSYPAYTSTGISIRTVFNPAIFFGGKIDVQSSNLIKSDAAGKLSNGNGIWIVNSLNHVLESLVPHGSWFSDIQATIPGVVILPA